MVWNPFKRKEEKKTTETPAPILYSQAKVTYVVVYDNKKYDHIYFFVLSSPVTTKQFLAEKEKYQLDFMDKLSQDIKDKSFSRGWNYIIFNFDPKKVGMLTVTSIEPAGIMPDNQTIKEREQ